MRIAENNVGRSRFVVALYLNYLFVVRGGAQYSTPIFVFDLCQVFAFRKIFLRSIVHNGSALAILRETMPAA